MITMNLHKMNTLHKETVEYSLESEDQSIELNQYIGKQLTIQYVGKIHCVHCGRETKKSFNQGYCYPCFRRLAQCDICIVKPEKCHYHEGTCREPDWALGHCFQPHMVYLANSSGVKVGITRLTQIPFRWMDQGARQALPIIHVQNRYQSGILEVLFKEHVADKTDWRKMLKSDPEDIDLINVWADIYEQSKAEIERLQQQWGDDLKLNQDLKIEHFNYPVQSYPTKIKSANFDKIDKIEGVLKGIKGQYLIFSSDTVFNVRKHSGYQVQLLLPS